ncbi:MAG: helix-turn-helix domain-containing protein [Prosthecobacter sp.]
MEAEAIRHYRESKNLTQSQFAALLRVSPTAVTQWEKGQRPAGPAALLLEHLIHGTPLFSAEGGAADWNMPLTLKEWEDLERLRVRTGFSSVRDYLVWLARRDLEQARQAHTAAATAAAAAAAPPSRSAPRAAARKGKKGGGQK